jgi:hypothetical protein
VTIWETALFGRLGKVLSSYVPFYSRGFLLPFSTDTSPAGNDPFELHI